MHIGEVCCAAISAAATQQTEIAIGFIVIDQYLISILLGVTA